MEEISNFENEIADYSEEQNNGWGADCHCGTFSQRVTSATGNQIGGETPSSAEPRNLVNEFKQVRLGSRIPRKVE